MAIFYKIVLKKSQILPIYVHIYIYFSYIKNFCSFFPMSMSEGHIPLQKALFSFVQRWKLKKCYRLSAQAQTLGKLFTITGDKCCIIASSGAQPHVMEAMLALSYWLSDFPERSVVVPGLFRSHMYMESMYAYSPYLVGWLRNFTLNRGTVARGAERTVVRSRLWCAAELDIRVYSAASFTVTVLKLWKYVLE